MQYVWKFTEHSLEQFIQINPNLINTKKIFTEKSELKIKNSDNLVPLHNTFCQKIIDGYRDKNAYVHFKGIHKNGKQNLLIDF